MNTPKLPWTESSLDLSIPINASFGKWSWQPAGEHFLPSLPFSRCHWNVRCTLYYSGLPSVSFKKEKASLMLN